MNSISDIKHSFYINLETRPDRKHHVEQQLKTIGVNAERFNAIKMKNGALGCATSHLQCLETAKKNNWDHVLIVEDDIKFLNPTLFIQQMNKFLETHKDFDVVIIAGNNMGDFKIIDDTCVRVTHCQTTTGYLVRSHYFDTLIDNYTTGIHKLIHEPDKPVLYAIDQYWCNLQIKDIWYLIIPLTVIQREDYSDIEKRPINYSKIMIDLDKSMRLQTQKELSAVNNKTYNIQNSIVQNKPSKKINMNI